MPCITVFTPTYNRKETLNALYKSLCKQKYQDFEWLIVDDGSTDTTKDTVAVWITENIINIVYVYKKNGGKHTAHNLGVKSAKGDIFLICDSDDYLVDDALSLVMTKWGNYKNSDKIAGLIAYKGKSESQTLGDNVFPNVTESNVNSLMKNTGVFDTTQIYRTSILKQFPFPEYEDERFVTENLCWGSIDLAGYLVGVLPKILEICEYRADGLTMDQDGSTNEYKNPKGFADYSLVMHGLCNELNEKLKWFAKYLFFNSLAKRKVNFSWKNIIAFPCFCVYKLKYFIVLKKTK